MTKFPYQLDKEMHGFNKSGFEKLCGQAPDFVCRATLFGGSKEAILSMYDKCNSFLRQALDAGYIGTEEAIFSGLAKNSPSDFNLVSMPNGDIKNFLITLRG